jgi:hypothetical protein
VAKKQKGNKMVTKTITQKLVDSIPLPQQKQQIMRDSALKGFGLRLTPELGDRWYVKRETEVLGPVICFNLPLVGPVKCFNLPSVGSPHWQ